MLDFGIHKISSGMFIIAIAIPTILFIVYLELQRQRRFWKETNQKIKRTAARNERERKELSLDLDDK